MNDNGICNISCYSLKEYKHGKTGQCRSQDMFCLRTLHVYGNVF